MLSVSGKGQLSGAAASGGGTQVFKVRPVVYASARRVHARLGLSSADRWRGMAVD
jgi:hypothetical protein